MECQWRAVCAETRKHGSGRGLRKSTAAMRKGGAFLLYYIGNGKLIGHGGGIGPTIKKLIDYSKTRYSRGTGYVRTLRVIQDDKEQLPDVDVVPADPMKKPPVSNSQHGIRITGGHVNLRTGPGTDFDIARIAKQGEVYHSIDTTGWSPILLDNDIVWVSEKLSERTD